jgi:hypothetical protein
MNKRVYLRALNDMLEGADLTSEDFMILKESMIKKSPLFNIKKWKMFEEGDNEEVDEWAAGLYSWSEKELKRRLKEAFKRVVNID